MLDPFADDRLTSERAGQADGGRRECARRQRDWLPPSWWPGHAGIIAQPRSTGQIDEARCPVSGNLLNGVVGIPSAVPDFRRLRHGPCCVVVFPRSAGKQSCGPTTRQSPVAWLRYDVHATCYVSAPAISTRSSVGSDSRSTTGVPAAVSAASSTQTDLYPAAGAERLTRELTEPTDQLEAGRRQQPWQLLRKDASEDQGHRPRVSLI